LQATREAALRERSRRASSGTRLVQTLLTRKKLQSSGGRCDVAPRKAKDTQRISTGTVRIDRPTVQSQALLDLAKAIEVTKKSDGLAKRSFNSLTSGVAQFVRECGDYPTEERICAWINAIESRDGRKNRRADVGNFLGWATRTGGIADNLIERISVSKHDAERPIVDLTPGILSPEDAMKLLDSARQRHD